MVVYKVRATIDGIQFRFSKEEKKVEDQLVLHINELLDIYISDIIIFLWLYYKRDINC
jgi:hypothetical protein